MDQRLFVLARQPALVELLSGTTHSFEDMKFLATAAMLVGWATGGLIFGIMSDKVGRVKTMITTLIIYSGFTGLSGLSQTWVDFFVYRFLVGLGVGGMFGAATSLVAESVPQGFRAIALGSLQALSAMGNILGSLISLKIPPGAENVIAGFDGWRVLFFVGVVPALLIIPFVLILKEPEAWKQAKEAAKESKAEKAIGSISELFVNPRWRRSTIVGLLLGVSGMIGLWGIGFFSPELIGIALEGVPQAQVDRVKSIATALQDGGALFGMITFTIVATYVGRRVAFLGSFILALVVTAFVFKSLNSASDAYWMLPMMGFTQLALFAGYSIYFPELFPTRLRGTGVGFCYNTVRYATAGVQSLAGHLSHSYSFRNLAVAMSSIYLLGIVALIWAPETKGKPLPED